MPKNMDTGSLIRQFRTRKKLSQSELAQKVGTSQSVIGFYEQGKRKPRLENLKKIADALDVDVNVFLVSQTESKNESADVLSPEAEHAFNSVQHHDRVLQALSFFNCLGFEFKEKCIFKDQEFVYDFNRCNYDFFDHGTLSPVEHYDYEIVERIVSCKTLDELPIHIMEITYNENTEQVEYDRYQNWIDGFIEDAKMSVLRLVTSTSKYPNSVNMAINRQKENIESGNYISPTYNNIMNTVDIGNKDSLSLISIQSRYKKDIQDEQLMHLLNDIFGDDIPMQLLVDTCKGNANGETLQKICNACSDEMLFMLLQDNVDLMWLRETFGDDIPMQVLQRIYGNIIYGNSITCILQNIYSSSLKSEISKLLYGQSYNLLTITEQNELLAKILGDLQKLQKEIMQVLNQPHYTLFPDMSHTYTPSNVLFEFEYQVFGNSISIETLYSLYKSELFIPKKSEITVATDKEKSLLFRTFVAECAKETTSDTEKKRLFHSLFEGTSASCNKESNSSTKNSKED